MTGIARGARRAGSRLVRLAVAAATLGVAAPAVGASAVPGGFPLPAARRPPAGRPVVLAVVDDAFRLDHRDLSGLWAVNAREIGGNGLDDDGSGRVDDVVGWDVADGDAGVAPPSDRLGDFAHGTHLAGVVAAVVRGVYGDAAPDAVRLLPVKVLEDRAERTTLRAGFDGIAYALDRGADVILCAWSVVDLREGERAILDRARAEGVLVVAAAGNAGDDTPQYPAAVDGALSVAALDAASAKLPRSSFGGTVDLAAPGLDVEGADVHGVDGRRTDSGTSPAAALVAAAAAVVWREHPGWTSSEVRAALLDAAVPAMPDDERLAASLGAGRVDLAAALAGSPWTHRGLWPEAAGALPLRRTQRGPVSFSLVPPGVVDGVRLALDPVRVSPRALRAARLDVHAGRSPDDPVAWTGTLDAFPGELVVPGRRAYVRFTPGRPGLDAFLRYRAEPVDVSARWCRGTVTLTEPGVLEDGSGDALYAPATDCRWLITAPEGQVVRFTFDRLDTEAGVDQVIFFLGPSTAGRMMAGFSGQELPPVLTTWGRQVLVWFVADTERQASGWRVRFEFVPAP